MFHELIQPAPWKRVLFDKLSIKSLHFRSQMVHYNVQKSLPLTPVLTQISPVLLSLPSSSKWSLSFLFPHPKHCMHFTLPSQRAACLTRFIILDSMTKIIFVEE